MLRDIRRGLDGDVSLDALAGRAGQSKFQLHRAFSRAAGETPKRYAMRLRLQQAAARLAAGDDSVLDVALSVGFASHEVFTRAFRRHFGHTPTEYRTHALRDASPAERRTHQTVVESAGPCIGLFHIPTHPSARRTTMPTLEIARRTLAPQHVLFVHREVPRSGFQPALAECLGKAFAHAQQTGVAMTGRPFTRYLSVGPGLWVFEAGTPMAAAAPGEGEVVAGTLTGGPVCVAVHAGPYDQLQDTYAAMETWMKANGTRPGGPPWESYITDPADHPNPADWRTEIYWPLAE